jgi:pyruvate/2-oxoglutarate dehydrogenase complex dihydrolipoamide dehydrogenase (E3) component
MPTLHQPDLCVIGAGSGGLSVAAAAAQLGASVVLIEKGKMGGDCLNYGCVPSKALIAAAKQAYLLGQGEKFGIAKRRAQVDYEKVHDHIHGVIAAIAPNDSVERFTGLGVTVIEAAAEFRDARTVIAGDNEVKARRFVVATGSSAGIPPVDGLIDVPYLTNETIFDLTKLPSKLIILGGGPIGMELAQAHRRLGAQVTVLEMFEPLGKDDPELTRFVLDKIKEEGVTIRSGVKVLEVSETDRGGIAVTIEDGGRSETLNGTHILVAAGRIPNVEGLNLEAAGIKYSRRGIEVTKGLRTTNRKAYAIGDVAGGFQFTHMANYHAGLVIRNALFRLPVKVDNTKIPWVTFTDPELAHVGLNENQARERHGRISVLRWPFAENDRAQAERRTEGLVKVICSRRGRIVGASIVGAHAGELIQPWSLAISSGLKIKAMTDMVVPYPTYGEANKRAAVGYYVQSIGSPWIRKVIDFLAKFG